MLVELGTRFHAWGPTKLTVIGSVTDQYEQRQTRQELSSPGCVSIKDVYDDVANLGRMELWY
jgi:hypothetical protein